MKLVREHINEKFTDESDPIHDLGIGDFDTFFKIERMSEAYPELIWFTPKDSNLHNYVFDEKLGALLYDR